MTLFFHTLLFSGVGVAFMSYNGGVRLSATIDKKIISTQEHADLLSQCINEELMNLRTSASSYGEENMV